MLAGVVVCIMTACSTETTVTDNTASTDGTETAVEEQETKLTCAELSSNYDEYQGKTITLTAVSWGNSETMDGLILVNLGDKKLDGMESPTVTIDMTDKAKATSIKKDSQVTVTGKVGKKDYGVVHIENPTIK